jgi:hypothetical protein
MSERAALIDHLERLGFYAYADPVRVTAAKRQAIAGGYLYGEDTKRFFFCDCEDLAEGGVLCLLEQLRAQLAVRGVVLAHLAQDCEDDHYDVTIDSRPYRIYGPEVQDAVEYWRVSTARTLALINDLLARAGSEERVYHLGGAEDGAAVFLTPAMVDLINGNRGLDDGWIPEQP